MCKGATLQPTATIFDELQDLADVINCEKLVLSVEGSQMVKVRGLPLPLGSIIALTILASTTVLPSDADVKRPCHAVVKNQERSHYSWMWEQENAQRNSWLFKHGLTADTLNYWRQRRHYYTFVLLVLWCSFSLCPQDIH